MKNTWLLILIGVFGSLLSCKKETTPVPEQLVLTRKTADYDGQFAHDWVQIAGTFIKENSLYAPQAARLYGYMGLAFWESTYGGIPNARSLGGQINDYPQGAFLDPQKEYDWAIVLSHALKVLLPALVDNATPDQIKAIEVLALKQEADRVKNGVSATVRAQSEEYGMRVGLRLAERLERDGREIIRNIVPVVPVRGAATQWYWDPKTLGQNAVEPLWGTMRTFVISNSQMCESDAPLPYAIEPSSPFYKEAAEVSKMPRNNANRALAYHWEDGPGRTSSAAGHWLNIAQQILQRDKKNLAETAKAYCLVGMTAADALSVCWYMKYKYFLLRPVTYIREQINAQWEPIINTPPYPDYISGAAMLGGAAPVALVSAIGDGAFTDKTHLGSALYTPEGGPFVLPERSFTSLVKAGEEQAESRVIAGTNYRRSCAQGLLAGRCVGNNIVAKLQFK